MRLSTCWRRCCFCAARRRRHAPAAAATEVGDAGHSAGSAAVHPVLCGAVSVRPEPAELLTNLAGLSLVFLPLTFSWAIVRYRLMDTDLIFKRGVAYTLATGLIVGGYFGIIALISVLVHNAMPVARECGLVAAILVTAAVFDPLKRRIQSWVDKAFDRHRYDYREALVEFGRSLNSETDLRALLDSIVERLPETLLVTRVAVFLAEEEGLAGQQPVFAGASHGLSQQVRRIRLARPGVSGLRPSRRPISTSFFENAQAALHLPRNSSGPRRCLT